MCSVMSMEICEPTVNNQLEADSLPNSLTVVYDELGYRRKLKKIDEELVKKDVERLKFLCRDLVPASTLEAIQRGIDLFPELEAKQKLGPTNLKYLAECLLAIERADLLLLFGFDINHVKRLICNQEEVSKYRKVLLEIADDLTKKEVASLVYLAKGELTQRGIIISKMKYDKITSPFQLFLTLEQSQSLCSTDVTLLAGLLAQIGRPDLYEKAHQYQGVCQHEGDLYSQSEQDFSSTSIVGFSGSIQPVSETYKPGETIQSGLPVLSQEIKGKNESNVVISHIEAQISNPGCSIDIVQGFSAGNITEGVREMRIDSEVLPEYEMKARPRGYCLIINNVKFYKIKDDVHSHVLKDREGSDVDAIALAGVFSNLDFTVEVQENLTDTEMVGVCMEMARKDHTKFDCFVCCILTHGEYGKLFGCNGCLTPITEITSCFKAQRCPGLIQKPKLFFLQACQGKHRQLGYSSDIEMDGNEDSTATIPDEADFLLGYATVPGFVSYRSKTQGSWYITTLCDNLRKYGNAYDVLSLLTKVNQEVSRGNAEQEGGPYKQVPAPMHTLRKKVHFR